MFVHLFVWVCVCGFVRLLFLPFISPVSLKEIALGINHLPFRSKYLKQYQRQDFISSYSEICG